MSKYKAKKVTYDGFVFDSKKEANRYRELRLLEKAGVVTELELQKRYELIPAQYESYPRYGRKGNRIKDGQKCVEKAVYYLADFDYYQDGKHIVEDVKGYKGSTAYAVFALKRKIMLYRYGIKIKEI